jgi:hypothetical protein
MVVYSFLVMFSRKTSDSSTGNLDRIWGNINDEGAERRGSGKRK